MMVTMVCVRPHSHLGVVLVVPDRKTEHSSVAEPSPIDFNFNWFTSRGLGCVKNSGKSQGVLPFNDVTTTPPASIDGSVTVHAGAPTEIKRTLERHNPPVNGVLKQPIVVSLRSPVDNVRSKLENRDRVILL